MEGEKFLARLERERDDGMDGWMEGAENILRILDQRSALWLLLCLVNKALRQTSTKVEDLLRLPNVRVRYGGQMAHKRAVFLLFMISDTDSVESARKWRG